MNRHLSDATIYRAIKVKRSEVLHVLTYAFHKGWFFAHQILGSKSDRVLLYFSAGVSDDDLNELGIEWEAAQ